MIPSPYLVMNQPVVSGLFEPTSSTSFESDDTSEDYRQHEPVMIHDQSSMSYSGQSNFKTYNLKDRIISSYNYTSVLPLPDKSSVHGSRTRTEMDFNEEYQVLTDHVCRDFVLKNDVLSNISESSFQSLLKLVKDFVDYATLYGKIIISEQFSPISDKLIKPASLAGVAGGVKFIQRGILFKFAVDNKGIYGWDDEAAAKAAGHEMKGLMGYYHCRVAELRFPLMALIDYRGYRLVAMSLLPVSGKDTLVYGSDNGGDNVYNLRDDVAECMRQTAEKLNIKGHLCGMKRQEVLFHSATDIEVHGGYDGRIYMLDLARTFPPEAPVSNCAIRNKKRTVYYQLLRPEFVRNWETPLNPDAHTSFGWRNPEDDAELTAATKHLKEVLIPDFVHTFEQGFETRSASNQTEIHKQLEASLTTQMEKTLLNDMHRVGINLRHLGLVYRHAKTERLKNVALTEIVVRCVKSQIKSHWRGCMKQRPTSGSEEFKSVAVDILNTVIGRSDKTRMFWEFDLKRHVHEKFFDTFRPSDFFVKFNFQVTDIQKIFVCVCQMVGIVLTPAAMVHCMKAEWYQQEKPLHIMDIDRLEPQVKALNIIPFIEGILLLAKAEKEGKKDGIWTLHSAEQQFQKALQLVPGGLNELYFLSLVEYRLSGQKSTGLAERIGRLDMAQSRLKYLRKSIRKSEQDQEMYEKATLLYADVLHKQGILRSLVSHTQKAIILYRAHLKKYEQDPHAHYKIAEDLWRKYTWFSGEDPDLLLEATDHARRATEADGTLARAWEIYAIIRTELGKRNHAGIGKNWITPTDHAFMRAHSLHPARDKTLYEWAYSLLVYGKQTKSIDFLTMSLFKYWDATEICPRKYEAVKMWECAVAVEQHPASKDRDDLLERVEQLKAIAQKLQPMILPPNEVVPSIPFESLHMDGAFLKSNTYVYMFKGCYQGKEVTCRVARAWDTKTDRQQFLNHFEVYRIVKNNERFLQCYGVSLHGSSTILVGEVLSKIVVPLPSWRITYKYLLDVAKGVSCLHAHKLIHNSISLNHVYIDHKEDDSEEEGVGRAKLGGFRLTILEGMLGVDYVFDNVPPSHSAPELTQNRVLNTKTDIFSFGITMLEMTNNQHSLDFSRRVRTPTNTNLPKKFGELVSACTSLYPGDRPTMSEVVQKLEELYQAEL
eukprot:TRINITY_DN5149_c0_g4_i2.p1 TRINITY_DN5149_c0_g4~~TRINITY_DN5149_c0_g4_i2.p1  ORF type:complete len:1162 (-),score=193.15 TRINITY_DN5149_c0_g4_i2:138-3623(-)